jgi:hypothetical protein
VERWFERAVTLIAIAIGLIAVHTAVAPMLGHWDALGGHDWDQMAAHRYLMVKSLRQYGQFPFWDPYNCGGHPSWAGIESGTAVVSPWFPLYLLLKLPIALRLEVVGTALLSFAGTWLLAGRFTKHAALRLLVCAVFVVNGRWALQVASGHTWHLYYCWMPWALYFVDRSFDGERPTGPIIAAGVVFALMVYNGAIYPLPQTVLIAGLYATWLAIARRTLRPLYALAASGILGLGLAAPKLLPMAEALSRFPRATDSPEVLDLRTFVVMLVEREQAFGTIPSPVSHWGWHEWGMYVGLVPCALLFIGIAFARGTRENALKWIGVLAVLLGFGAFHPNAPWPLLRHLPVFSSQHVPSRWLYPAVLLFGLVTASVATRWLVRAGRAKPWLEVALLALAAWIAVDIARVASNSTRAAFWMTTPKVTVQNEFHQYTKVPPELQYAARDWAPPALPAMMANSGVIECVSFPGLTVFARDLRNHVPGLGAKGMGDYLYRGEVFPLSKVGTAEYESWSPNFLRVRVHGAQPGDRVVINQNWESGWKADGVPALNDEDRIAAPISSSEQTIVFRYRPRLLGIGFGCFAISVLAIAAALFRNRLRPLLERLRARIQKKPEAV